MTPEPASPLLTADFDYPLPEDLIASHPADRRDKSRLLVLDREQPGMADRRFPDLLDYLTEGDALVVNDTRVFPARLVGRKPTGARAEILLLRQLPEENDGRTWQALVRPGGKLKPGRVVEIADGFELRVEDSFPDGSRRVRLHGAGDAWALVERFGQVPLPPYIQRAETAADRERYQTVYARERGSVAAPTAGLHFTTGLIEQTEALGISVVPVTLHVGVGTFRPLDAEVVEEHRMHSEWYQLSEASARVLNRTRAAGRRVWAVGTTSARTLETVVSSDGSFAAAGGWTDLFIYPPYHFRAVDGLLTNFHLPRSSLLMLVAALVGRDRALAAYRHAIEQRYRFYSYGDAMLVV
ncbi:MAG: tRNA preQ1(34) S-adenosylmethionine ribosyltransferase-isomerase QueA [Gemmatimonadetes bacterium]|nr:tRNA preQ1(34) S-adenosylmethionine ribosyltransferase-isomerase QueA [Gemmatimonadota bacterium]